jgi:MinD-like ATPase involved in chromosome partitioning or flagellar assembly
MTSPGRVAGSLVGAVVRGTAGAAELTRADTLLRTPLSLSRRIGFVALAGGSGTSATAGSVASLLASRRAGTVLAVDAGAGSAGLGWQTGAVAPETGQGPDPDLAALRQTARSMEEARQGLFRNTSGLHLLDLAGAGPRAPSVASWRGSVTPIARFFDLVVTDWGVRPWPGDLEEVADASNVVAVVARADRYAACSAAAVIPQLLRAHAAPRVLLVLVDVGHTSDRIAAGLRRRMDVPVLTLGYERERARFVAPNSRHFSARTRRSHIRIATAVVTEAIGSPAARLPRTSPTPSTSRTAVPA